MTTPGAQLGAQLGAQQTAGRAALVLRWLTRATLLVVLAAIIGAITVLMILPRATNGTALTVLTGSMSPEIAVGSIVLVRPVDPDTLRVGDIATYQKEPDVDEFITHRIVGIERGTQPTTYIFKGDANRGRDLEPVPATAVRGEVWFHAPYLGAIRDALHGVAGLSLLAMLLLGGYAIGQVLGAIRDKRDAAARVENVDIACDRALVLARFSLDSVYGAAPGDAAKEWGGVLLCQEDSTFTVLLAPEPWDLAATVLGLRRFDPTTIEVLEAPTPITVNLDKDKAKVWDPVPVQPQGGQEGAKA